MGSLGWLAQAITGAFVALCLSLVASFLVLVLIPRLHKPVRARLRPQAVHHVERGLEVVVAAQQFQSPWLTWLFTKSSHSVSVTFYASFLPTLFWLGLPELGRDLVVLMALALYVGNAIKDLVCSPRPLGVAYGRQRLTFLGASDEEVELNAKEYGLPSSHTLNTLCLNYLLVWYLHDRHIIATGTAGLLYGLVALWVVWIACSRVYLGLHTPVDILAGAVTGLAVLVCFIALEGYLGRWLQSGPWAVAHTALASLVLLRLHPRPLQHTPSYEFSTSFVGAMFGIVAGVAAISPQAHIPGVQLAQLWTGPGHTLAGSRLLWALRRLGAGFVVVGVMKEASRAALLATLPLLYRFFPLPIRRLWQPPMHNLAKPVGVAGRNGKQQQAQQQGEQQANGWHRQQREQQSESQQAARVRPRKQQNGTDSTMHVHATAAEADAHTHHALPPRDPRLAELPHNAQGVPWDVDVTSRFFAYAAIGAAVAGVAPRLLEALGW